jgi:hypothetical protein
VSFVDTKLSVLQANNRKNYQITTFLRGKKQIWFYSEGRIEPIEKNPRLSSSTIKLGLIKDSGQLISR